MTVGSPPLLFVVFADVAGGPMLVLPPAPDVVCSADDPAAAPLPGVLRSGGGEIPGEEEPPRCMGGRFATVIP